MTIRIHKLKTPGYGVTWTEAGVKHSQRVPTRAAATALRADLLARPSLKPDGSPVPREWRVKGAETRNASLTPEQRTESARNAARARWGQS